jgi:hypothetical protein
LKERKKKESPFGKILPILKKKRKSTGALPTWLQLPSQQL